MFHEFKEEEGISGVLTNEEVITNDYNLSPSRYITQNGEDTTLPLDEAVVLVKEVEEEKAKSDKKIKQILEQLGY